MAGRLAARHGIKVALRTSYYGGTTAIVVLPFEIIVAEHEAGAWFGPGGTGELPAGAADGMADKAGPAGTGEWGPAFGMTGRHRLVRSALSTEDGMAEGAELAAGPAGALAGRAFPALPPAAPGHLGRSAPGPAQAPPGSPAAAARTIGSAEPAGSAGPARSGEPSGFSGPAGPVGSAEATEPAEVAWPGPGRPVNGKADGTYLGLPRRARLASLAPQLRGQPGASEPSSHPLASGEAAGSPARSPEQAGSRLAELQDGWLRGRLDDLDSPGAAPPGLHPGGRPEDASGEEAEPDDREGQS